MFIAEKLFSAPESLAADGDEADQMFRVVIRGNFRNPPAEAEFDRWYNEPHLPRHGSALPLPKDLIWDPQFGEISFTYGTAEARLPSGENQLVVFGQVQTGLDRLAVYCRARRFEGLGEIRIEAS